MRNQYEDHLVLLTDGTTGAVSRAGIDYSDIHDFIGDYLEVRFQDENGNTVTRFGEVAEVLEVAEADI